MATHAQHTSDSRGSQTRKAGYTLYETVAALGILVLVLGSFDATLRGLMRYERALQWETKGLIVLNNAVERIAADPDYTTATVTRILEEEFRGSDLSTEAGFSADCVTGAEQMTLLITKPGRKSLAQVRVPLRK